jgi:hypothetical protein
MQKLNRSKPFGYVTPPMTEADMDRAAFYDQDGRLFDAHDREIVRGVALVAEKAAPAPAPAAKSQPAAKAATAEASEPAVETAPADAPPALSLDEVIAAVTTMPWAGWHKQAKRILGDACPGGKRDTLDALNEKLKEEHQPNLQAQKAEAAAKPNGKDLDLAAWGRGTQPYLFGEVRKAILARDNKMVTTQKDAVDHLIETRVITAAEARAE